MPCMTDTKIPLSAHKAIVACLEEELANRDAAKDEDSPDWEIVSWADFGKDEFGYIEDGCAYVKVEIGDKTAIEGWFIYLVNREDDGRNFAEIVPSGWTDGVQFHVSTNYVSSATMKPAYEERDNVKVYRAKNPPKRLTSSRKRK
jgi:hypothetical protein